MIKETPDKFSGFSSQTLEFLKNLKINNSKDWFESHKADYQKYVLSPLQSLVQDLSEFMLTIDPELEVRSPKVISRIYRDTRFSKDKSPYRSTMWLTFKKLIADWQNAPAYFFEIAPDSYRYGMGFYGASKETMAKFREQIDDNFSEFSKATSFYAKQKAFVLEGEKYKRIIDNTKSAEIQNWYQRKSFYLVCNLEIDEHLFSAKLLDDLISDFSLLAPFYHYLQQIKL